MTRHIVMYSGGAASYLAAKRVCAMFGAESVTLLFADTKIEDPDLYRFLVEGAERLGAKLEVIADGRTPWEVFEDERFIGNSRRDPCSKILKRKLLDKWLRTNCDPLDTLVYVGLSWCEPARYERLTRRRRGWQYLAPLTWAPHLDKDEEQAALRADGIEPPGLYAEGFTHNNCGGFCVKAGHASFKRLLDKRPGLYAHHEGEEQRLRGLGINGAIMTDRRGKKRVPMTMREFRIRVEGGAVVDMNDNGGCGCALPA